MMNAETLAALLPYLQHFDDCQRLLIWAGDMDTRDCTCGLSDAIAESSNDTIGPRLRALADRPIYSGPDLKELREELLALAAESDAT